MEQKELNELREEIASLKKEIKKLKLVLAKKTSRSEVEKMINDWADINLDGIIGHTKL